MRFPEWLKVYGDLSFRGECPPESAEQVTFFNELRRRHPDSWGRIALHPRNEGKRHYAQVNREKLEGMAAGASDVIIPGCPAFVCEIKRRDHTQSKWQKDQLPYLEAAHDAGAFVCIALGVEAALAAFDDYLMVVNAGKTPRNG